MQFKKPAEGARKQGLLLQKETARTPKRTAGTEHSAAIGKHKLKKTVGQTRCATQPACSPGSHGNRGNPSPAETFQVIEVRHR